MTLLLIIYFIGCIVAYVIIKKSDDSKGIERDWNDVYATLILSFISWIVLLFFIKSIFTNSKPPKWL